LSFSHFLFQWRLRCLWQHLLEVGYNTHDFDYIWKQIEEIVVKSILVALPEMRREFHEMADLYTYNTYKLLGYDMLIDNDLKVHMIEVNGRPALLEHVLDKAVNRPMVKYQLNCVLKWFKNIFR
jgi:hypothetical protein